MLQIIRAHERGIAWARAYYQVMREPTIFIVFEDVERGGVTIASGLNFYLRRDHFSDAAPVETLMYAGARNGDSYPPTRQGLRYFIGNRGEPGSGYIFHRLSEDGTSVGRVNRVGGDGRLAFNGSIFLVSKVQGG